MNLRQLRIRLTLVYGLLSAVAIGALAWVAIDTGRSRIFDTAEREARGVARDVADGEDAPNSWYVSIAGDTGYEEVSADFWIEPPLQTITKDALWNDQLAVRFNDDSGSYIGAVQPIDEEEAFVAFIESESFIADANSLRLRISLAALGAVAAVAAVGWIIAGRSLRPTRVVLAQQRDFIADAAHELRTPLAVIQASATQSLSRERGSAEYRGSLQEIAEAADRASSGVNELLEFARLEAGQALPRLAPLRLDLLIEEVAASVRHDSSTVEAVVGNVVVANADYNLLRQAVHTVVQNAATRASHVRISVESKGRDGVISVSDDGPGFDEANIEHIFDRFHRGDRSGSTGLGMAIAKKIVDAHSGTIAATNRDEGGALVSIGIPLTSSADK
jgi:signal transduction histidine kinase